MVDKKLWVQITLGQSVRHEALCMKIADFIKKHADCTKQDAIDMRYKLLRDQL